MAGKARPTGMVGFTIVWFGQLVSLLGTGMTQFGLMIWAWKETGSATALALVFFFGFMPNVLMMPFAGAMVDRYSRKAMMIVSDLAAGLATAGMLLLYSLGALHIWHVYILIFVSGAFQAFQFPAYSAAITMMVKKEHYARASAMLSTARDFSGVFAPIVAGVLLGFIGLSGIMVIDIVTFVFAISAILAVHVPQPPPSEEGKKGRRSFMSDAFYGFRYIYERKPLLGLQLVFLTFNLVVTFGFVVDQPMVLARTGDSAPTLGTVLSMGGIGGVAGGVVMTLWGGPKRKVDGIIGGMLALSVGGIVLFGLGREVVVWSVGLFIGAFIVPIANGCSQAIWQAKVPPDLQGRVFATRALIASVGTPIAMLLAGPIADLVAEPALTGGGVPVASALVGSGPGAGMSLMLVIAGVLGAIVAVAGYSVRSVREAESLIPDHSVAAGKAGREGEEGEEGGGGDGSAAAAGAGRDTTESGERAGIVEGAQR